MLLVAVGFFFFYLRTSSRVYKQRQTIVSSLIVAFLPWRRLKMSRCLLPVGQSKKDGGDGGAVVSMHRCTTLMSAGQTFSRNKGEEAKKKNGGEIEDKELFVRGKSLLLAVSIKGVSSASSRLAVKLSSNLPKKISKTPSAHLL